MLDQLNRQTSRTLPKGQTEFFTYTDEGLLETHTSFESVTTTNGYDFERLETKTFTKTGQPTDTLNRLVHLAHYNATPEQFETQGEVDASTELVTYTNPKTLWWVVSTLAK